MQGKAAARAHRGGPEVTDEDRKFFDGDRDLPLSARAEEHAHKHHSTPRNMTPREIRKLHAQYRRQKEELAAAESAKRAAKSGIPQLGLKAAAIAPEEDEMSLDEPLETTHVFKKQNEVGDLLEYRYARRSLYVFGPTNPLRLALLRCMLSPWFDRFILLVILVNSVVLALADPTHMTEDYEMKTEGSINNTIVSLVDGVCTWIFMGEFIVKVIAMGFIQAEESYLKDGWNRLDFLVVVTGTMDSLPGMPKLSAVRVFRVLRPLRTLQSLPGMQILVDAMMTAIPQLGSVTTLLTFIFVIFGIMGLQLFSGIQHARCRLTPYPVTNEWRVGMDPEPYRCLEAPNFSFLGEGGKTYLKGTSPWATPRECYWPLHNDDTRICTFDAGQHRCPSGPRVLALNPPETWCGSSRDALGNFRFSQGLLLGEDGGIANATDEGAIFYGRNKLHYNDHYSEDFAFGFTTFDSMPQAMLSIFQSITLEGWTDIMYQTMDGYSAIAGALYFVVLVCFGSFFALNLMLAVLESSFHHCKEKADDMVDELIQMREDLGISDPNAASEDDSDGDGDGSLSPKKVHDLAPLHPEGSPLQKLHDLVTHEYFTAFITSLIVANTIVLALDRHNIAEEEAQNLEIANFVFTVVFAVEMCLKIPGLGVRGYFGDSFNKFDFFIVTMSFVELGIQPPSFFSSNGAEQAGSSGITAIRSFRLFRIFKLARSWKSMHQILEKTYNTVVDISSFACLLFLFMYIYALLGMQFFANKLHFDERGYPVRLGEGGATWEEWHAAEVPRTNFDSFTWAFTTVFVVLSGENWNAIMYDCMRGIGYMGAVYYVSLIIIGMFIVMNLFLAILLSHFGEDDSEEEEEVEVEDGPRFKFEVPEHVDLEEDLDSPRTPRTPRNNVRYEYIETNYGKRIKVVKGYSLDLFSHKDATRRFAAITVGNPKFENAVLFAIFISCIVLGLDNPLMMPGTKRFILVQVCNYVLTLFFLFECIFRITAMGFLNMPGAYLKDAWNGLDFVVVVISIVSWIYADRSDLKAVRALRALRALRPLRVINKAPGLKAIVNTMISSIPDVLNVAAVCLLFFLIFAIFTVTYLKGMFYGCQGDAFDEGAQGELGDFLTAPAPWADMTPAQHGWFYNASAAFADNGAPAGLTAAGLCGAAAAGGAAPCCPLWGKGAGLKHAADFLETVAPTSRQVCECWGMEWSPVVPQMYDNSLQALLTYFEIATTEGWIDVMLAAVDATGVDMQPIENHAVWWVWYFMFFMLFGSYLIMNLFVGVILDNFSRRKGEADQAESPAGEEYQLSELQAAWITTQEVIIQTLLDQKHEVQPPANKWRRKAYDVCTASSFEATILLCVMGNTLIMACNFYGEPQELTDFLNFMNFSFAMIFNAEFVIKFVGLGLDYFGHKVNGEWTWERWNMFDFAVVFGTNAGLILEAAGVASVGSLAMGIRTFRLGRVLRLMQSAKSMQRLFNTLIATLPGMGNIAMLLLLLFFIYAAIGIQLFAKVELGLGSGAVNEHGNFRTFWTSMLTLLRFATGENFNGYMHDMAIVADHCDADPPPSRDMCGFEWSYKAGCVPLNGCGNLASFPYFLSFTLLISFVFMNLFIGIILDGFGEQDEEKMNPIGIQADDVRAIGKVWKRFDADDTHFIPEADLRGFLVALEPPWGFGPGVTVSDKQLLKLSEKLELRVWPGGMLHFVDVLRGLSKLVVREQLEDGTEGGAKLRDMPVAAESNIVNALASNFATPESRSATRKTLRAGGGITYEMTLATRMVQKHIRKRNETRRAAAKPADPEAKAREIIAFLDDLIGARRGADAVGSVEMADFSASAGPSPMPAGSPLVPRLPMMPGVGVGVGVGVGRPPAAQVGQREDAMVAAKLRQNVVGRQ